MTDAPQYQADLISQIRNDIGRLLDTAYEVDPSEPLPERIAQLLAQLDSASTSAQRAPTK